MSFLILLAQAAAAATPEAVAAPQGVINYGPEFFASYRPANAMEMVQRVPGFTFDGGDDVRGFEGAAGNVLIDGQRPSSKSDNLESILRRLPASQVARVELIRGSAPGIDMQGKTVLVNLVRKDGGGFRGLVALATNHVIDDGRTAPQLRIEGSGGSNGRTWEASLLTARYFDDGAGDGPRVRIDPAGRVLIRSFVETEGNGGQTTLTGAYEAPFAAGKLRLNGLLKLDEFDYDEQNRLSFPGATEERDQFGNDEKQAEIGARFNRGFGERTSLEVVALQRFEDGHFGETFQKPGSTTFFSLDKEIGESIARGVVKHRYSPALSIEAGAEGAFNYLESETDFAINGDEQVLPAANVRVEEKRGEVFAKATWRPTPQWTFEGGLRQEGSKISSDGDVELSKTLYFTKPRFAATWAPRPTTQIRGRIEREVGQLDFDDFVADTDFNTGSGVQAGNPDLNPEQAWVGEVAVEQRFWGAGAVVLTYRHFELKDVIDRAPVTASNGDVFDAPANIGDGTKDEIAVTLTLPLQKVGWNGAQLRGQATWRDSEVTDPTTGEDREISRLRPVSWEARLTYDLPQHPLTLSLDVFGGWRQTSYRFNEIQDRKLKPWVSLSAEWKPKSDISIRAELANLTERGLRNTRTVYAGPRDTAAVAHVDDRDIQFGRLFFLRVRKTFGA